MNNSSVVSIRFIKNPMKYRRTSKKTAQLTNVILFTLQNTNLHTTGKAVFLVGIKFPPHTPLVNPKRSAENDFETSPLSLFVTIR